MRRPPVPFPIVTTFEALELAWVDARTTFGEWYLAETLGGPVEGRPGTTADREAADRTARSRLDAAVRAVDATGLQHDEARGPASIRSGLGSFDEIGPPGGSTDGSDLTAEPLIADIARVGTA